MTRKGLGEAPGLFDAAETADAPHYHGHRERLKAKFMEAGAGALADYEMLELVLFSAIPRRDVKPLAKRLIAEFGDFGHALSADPARLRAVDEMTDGAVRALKIVEAAAHRLARAKVLDRPAIASWAALLDYLRVALAHQTRESFRILFLDRKNVLIADEEQGKGTVDHVPVYVREVVRRALELNASALILVHNHPTWPFRSRSITPHHLETQELLGLS
jgi:DNA repair protein RadC